MLESVVEHSAQSTLPPSLPLPAARRRRRAAAPFKEARGKDKLAIRRLGIVQRPEGQSVSERIEIDVALLPDLGQAGHGGGEGTEGMGW